MFKALKGREASVLAPLLAVLIIGAVSYAQPEANPPGGNVEANFSSVQLPAGPKLTSSFGRYVGKTPASYDGNAGGYAAANALCDAAFDGSHLCSAREIINSYEYDTSGPITSATGDAWINNGPPAYIEDLSNDCNGWKSNDSNPAYSTYGSTWKLDGTQRLSLISFCSRTLPFACCSY